MKKNLNKLATLALTGAMVAGMSFGAFADEVEDASQNQGQQVTNYTAKNSFSFDKYLKIAGGDNVSVPHVKFTFTAEPYSSDVGEGEMLKEEAANTLNVYNGVTGNKEKKVTGDVEFTGQENKDTDSKVKEVVTLNNVTFSKAGVYRYKVTESFEQNKNSEFYTLYNKTKTENVDGIETTTVTQSSVENNTNKVEYIDVYVQYKDSKYTITNVVLMSTDPGTSEITVGADNTYNYAAKLAGVENLYSTKHDSNGKPSEDGNDNAIILTKKLGDTSFQNNSKEFTFTVKFENVPSDFVVTYATKSKDDKDYETATKWIKNSDGNYTVKLKAGESVKITGVPVGIKYSVTETSDTNYTPSIKLNDDANVDANGGADKDIWTLDSRVLSDSLVDNIEWTNTQNEITVTGVAMNIAPYAAMVLGAGAFAGIFLGGKRRKAEDED